MERHNRLIILVLVVVFLIPGLALAQNKSSQGYWDRGHYIGYMPPHLKSPEPTATTPQNEEAEKSVKQQDQADEQSKSVQQTQYMRYTQQPHTKQPRKVAGRTRVAQRQPKRGLAMAPQGAIDPMPMEGEIVGQQGMNGPMGGSDCGCGVENSCSDCGCGDCSYGSGYECGVAAVCWPRNIWGRVEYLGWWTSGMHVPALVTTSTEGYPTLDNSTTTVLFGNETINSDSRSGGRFTLGMWLDPCRTRGIDFAYLGLGNKSTTFEADSDHYHRLGRPFFDISSRGENAELISYPSNPATEGWVSVNAETQFQGFEVLFRRATKRCPCSQVDMLIGWRWLRLQDDLRIAQSVDNTLDLQDHFNTRNNFNGFEIGLQWQRPISCLWTFEALGKVAIGNTSSVVRIDGSQTGDASQGLLALDSNSGIHKRNSFASVAELGFSVKRRFACGLEATFGYSFVYWSDVLRAGDQIDLIVDPRQVPPDPQTASLPGVPMKQTDFWAQGLHFGLEYPF